MTQLDRRGYARLVAGTFGESEFGDWFTRKSQDTHPVFPPDSDRELPGSPEGRRQLIRPAQCGSYVDGYIC